MEALREKCREEVAAARKQLEAAEQRLAGVEMSMRTIAGEDLITPVARPPRTNVKQMILDLLKERGAEGVNANTVVEIAAQRGEHVERGTASSLLSRFKSDGVVVYDGRVYRFPKQTLKASEDALAVH